MKIKLLVLFALLSIINYKAQDDLKPYTFNSIANLKAPQTSDFIRYGNIPVNKYVGEPNLDIPLFNLKSSQLGDEINISLGYNFSGFIPNKRPDIVGLNWFLNTGGVITRQVNSIPDDQIGQSNTTWSNGMPMGINKHGLIVGLRNKSNCLPYHPNPGIFSLTDSNIGYFSQSDLDYKLKGCDLNNSYDGDADIFSFNFGGYTGKFFLGNDNEIKIIGENIKGFKIDINNIASQPTTNICKPLSSTIKITDDKGNEYYFGGESRNLEYNIPISHNPSSALNGNENETRGGLPIITSWYLRQIRYSNGETVNFNYKDDSLLSDNFCNGTPGNTYDWHGSVTNPTILERRKFIVYNKSYNQDLACVSNPGAVGNLSYSACSGSTYAYMITKKAILDEVNTSNYKVKLSYSLQPYIFNYEPVNELTYFQQIKNLKLDSIGLYTPNNQYIRGFQLTYELKGGSASQNSYPRLFLKSVQETGKNPYTFVYNLNNENLPKATTKQIDHWGFYNGKTANENMIYPIPSESTDANGDYYFTSSVRDADFTFSSKGILNEVVYPTKGSTIFEFESPLYQYRMERKKVNAYLPSLQSISGIIGGVRIKKIRHYSDIGILAKEKQFLYDNGILFQWPRYMALNSYGSSTNNGAPYQANVWMRSSSMNANVLESAIINYGTVTELETGNGSTISNYSNYLTNPDINDMKVSGLNTYNPYYDATDLELAKNYIGLFYNDLSLERGKLLQETINNNSGQIIRKVLNTYNEKPQRFNEYSAVIHLSGPVAQANKRYYYQTNLTKKVISDYFYDNGQQRETITTKDITYSDAPDYQPVNQRTIFTNGSVNEVSTKFAYQDGNTLMISKNMISIPVENTILNKVDINDAGKVISHNKNLYPTSLPTTQTGNLVLPISTLSYDIQGNSSSTEVTYNKYDTKGNIQQYTTKDGIPVAIVWGYNNTQPIAKVEGATYDQLVNSGLISAIITASDSDAATPTNEPALITALDNFRKSTSLSAYQITTYTYDPLIGVTSITPPSGIREVYVYDTANRLQEIRQDSKTGKLLKEFKYNYKN